MPRLNTMGRRSAITAPSYTTTGVVYDGSTTYITRASAPVGAVDGPLGIFSCWLNLISGNGQAILRNHSTATVNIQINSSNQLNIFLTNSGGTISFSITSTVTIDAGSGWHSLICAWDTNHAAGAKIGQMYMDGANMNPTFTDAGAAFNVNYNRTGPGIGAADNGINKFNGYMDEVYFNSVSFLDMTNLVNRYKFRGLTDHPADLGADGSTPTGSQPLIYVKGPHANWGTNLGSGGNFTVNGTFTDSPTNP